MISLKRSIAGLIVCLKPHVFLTLCIILVIARSLLILIQRETDPTFGRHQNLTWTLVGILIVALAWVAFFAFMMRFELMNELDTLLILFQCSKRGLRFLGVVAFHIMLLSLVALIVSSVVELSLLPRGYQNSSTLPQELIDRDQTLLNDFKDYLANQNYQTEEKRYKFEGINEYGVTRSVKTRGPITVVYKIWLTAIVYAFLYLLIENMVMFYTDLTLVEWVHISFLEIVAKLTGIDLSDYPAGEMLFNPLVRRRIR